MPLTLETEERSDRTGMQLEAGTDGGPAGTRLWPREAQRRLWHQNCESVCFMPPVCGSLLPPPQERGPGIQTQELCL